MIVSRNEVHGTLRKAALGAKLPAGTADDLAHAASWMEAQGLPALAMAVSYIETGAAARLNLATVFDRILAGESTVSVVANELLIGFAADAARHYDERFLIEWGLLRIAVAADGFEIVGGAEAARPGPDAAAAQVSRGPAPCVSPQADVIEVPDAVWTAANRLAAEFYVPASEASRLAGAGAGVNDND